jgi:hypothetical protein
MTSVTDTQQKVVVDRDILPLQLVDVEVAIDLCNDIMLIINEQMDRLEGSAISEASDLLALHDLQRQLAHTMRSSLTSDNMPHVREFIATYAPQVKRYFESGEVPAFIRG